MHATQSQTLDQRGLAVVVPCYNAGDRVRPVVESLLRLTARVTVVDDGSTDGSADGLAALGAEVIRLDPNQGKGFALMRGFEQALANPDTKYVAIVDADGQHDPQELPALLDAAEKANADLLIGSRTFDGPDVPWRSRFGNKLTALLTKLLYGRAITDTQSGYRLHSRTFLESVLADDLGGRYETEMAILVKAMREGFQIETAPIKTIYEDDNASSHFNKVRDSFRIYRVLLSFWSARKRK
jgi:glycosyltransferase involved in cell wall biosynthesis